MKRPEIEEILEYTELLKKAWEEHNNKGLMLIAPGRGCVELGRLIEVCRYVLYLEGEGGRS